MAEIDRRQSWRDWTERQIKGPQACVDIATRAAMKALDDGKNQVEVQKAVLNAAEAWRTLQGLGADAPAAGGPKSDARAAVVDSHPSPADSTLGHGDVFGSNGGQPAADHAINASRPANVDSLQSPSERPTGHRGIYDVVAADKSPLGVATLAALDDLVINETMRTKAFLATRGFRANYGFYKNRASALFGLVFLWFVLVGIVVFWPSLPHQIREIAGVVAVLWGWFTVFYAIYLLVATAIMAKKTKIQTVDGRIIINYGVFSSNQIAVELHFIRQVTWHQSFAQKLLGEATLYLLIDTAERKNYGLCLPGLASPKDMQALADKVRNVAQKLRQGNYYAKSFVG
ncbi:hypothetical protein C7410_101310 [Paraburkholderia silvatlantica]|uniref:Uncharacterized protein n=1 Tax=Paraburkholderia silvatlantica TaxID=321895 RepID=A0A2V4U2P3_9BURK|nr:PH domain-containing protein [Paraburkholderia silvatlantica]PYE27978.1 hypothetical protein C7410_101310 [Paraburkholderia silvatlantica]